MVGDIAELDVIRFEAFGEDEAKSKSDVWSGLEGGPMEIYRPGCKDGNTIPCACISKYKIISSLRTDEVNGRWDPRLGVIKFRFKCHGHFDPPGRLRRQAIFLSLRDHGGIRLWHGSLAGCRRP